MASILTNRISRIIAIMLAFVMAITIINYSDVKPANAQSADQIIADNTATSTPGYNTATGGGGGGCAGAACGWIGYSRTSNNSPSVLGLYGTQPEKRWTAYYLAGKNRVNSFLTYRDPQYTLDIRRIDRAENLNEYQCAGASRSYVDPVTGQWRQSYANGIYWVDNRQTTSGWTWEGPRYVYKNKYEAFYKTSPTGGRTLGKVANVAPIIGYNPPPPAVINVSRAGVVWKVWEYTGRSAVIVGDIMRVVNWSTGRDVVGYCTYPQMPYTAYKSCPTRIDATMNGPYDNNATNPRYPVLIAPGKFDPKTEVKQWRIPQLSTIGANYAAYGPNLGGSNSYKWQLVENCPDMYMNVRVNNTECWKNGVRLTGADNCSFTAGNYNKSATGQQIACRYGVYPSGYGQTSRVFVGCSGEFYNPRTYYRGDAWWCSTAPNGVIGWNTTDNFATNCKPATPPVCSWSNGTGLPTIRDPYGVVQPSGTQVQADGKPWTITYPTLNCPGSQNMWQQWIIGKNSKPTRDGLAGNNSTQPVWGSYQSSGNGYLVYSGSSTGATGWTNNVITVKFNQATITNSGSSNIVVGSDSPNPVTVAPGQPIPFGIYSKYNYSINDTSYSNVGGTVNFNNFKTVSGPMITFYAVSGRVTG